MDGGLLRSTPPTRVAPRLVPVGSSPRMPSSRNPVSTQSEAVANRSSMPASRPDAPRQYSARARRPCKKITGHRLGRAPHLDPALEPAHHPHQMGVIQPLVAAAMQPPPPGTKPAQVVPEGEESIEHNPVHTVITARHRIRIPQAELVTRHPLNLRTHPLARGPTARRTTTSGPSPGSGVAAIVLATASAPWLQGPVSAITASNKERSSGFRRATT
uniref:Uncharacterized protein n=1 Tax=Mycobacterium riyadhense TaxID=486698 RepID=A0A653F1H8_9MYCO|nr:hypothetical protein BIN_B_05054 [Mycobacterium riyadhense]